MCKKETEPLAETLLSNIQATWHFIKPFESFPPYLKKVILVKNWCNFSLYNYAT